MVSPSFNQLRLPLPVGRGGAGGWGSPSYASAAIRLSAQPSADRNASHFSEAMPTTRSISSSSIRRFATSPIAASLTRPRYASFEPYRSSTDARGSPEASLCAFVAGNGSVVPKSGDPLVISPALPIDAWRTFQPVYVASGSATSGSRIPATSLQSASTEDTSVG